MTLRALFAVMGGLSSVTAISFLLLFHPPNSRARDRTSPGAGLWWVSLSLRLLWLAALANGVRLLVLNVVNHDRPIQFASWYDTATATASIFIQTVATCVAFSVYLTYRRWEPPSE